VSETEREKAEPYEAAHELGECLDTGREHIEEDMVESLDGDRYICFWCAAETSVYRSTDADAEQEGDR